MKNYELRNSSFCAFLECFGHKIHIFSDIKLLKFLENMWCNKLGFLILSYFLAGKWAWPPGRRQRVWGLKVWSLGGPFGPAVNSNTCFKCSGLDLSSLRMYYIDSLLRILKLMWQLALKISKMDCKVHSTYFLINLFFNKPIF